MKWLWITLASLAAIVALVTIAGALSPQGHTAARRIRLRQSAAAVFAVLTDVATMPQWRRDLKAVELLPPRDGKRCYREVSGFGPLDLCVEREEPGRLLVLRIVTANSPFGGTWTFQLQADGDGTFVQLTEHGEVYNVIFRALARFVFGHAGTIEGYLKALATRFGEVVVLQAAVPEPAPLR